MKTAKSKLGQRVVDYLFVTAGSIVMAFGVAAFLAPNQIAAGGVSGLSTVLNHLFGLPIGLMILLFNVPLFLAGAKALGRDVLIKSIYGTVVSSVAIDLITNYLPCYEGDRLLAAIFGGVLSGLGLSLIFMRGGSSGGTDLLALLVRRAVPHMTLGSLIMMIDGAVVLFAGVAYRNLESILYAVIVMYISTTLINRVLDGLDYAKLLYIISDREQEIGEAITQSLSRGLTVLPGKGFYTGSDKPVLLCVVRRNESYTVRRLVHEIDPEAFLIVTDATEVLGEGFKAAQK
ncbi:YitT family protein [Feifania hominis]|uniref:YitT family protein n=1 Tax=Feifania hominis TaxID=2763660 RepID=A0A926DEC1_9FIRM|nr:YitT family protein [Feifania hominis]MBC8536287.1 YitT family protein [Feifania hominis]